MVNNCGKIVQIWQNLGKFQAIKRGKNEEKKIAEKKYAKQD